MKKSYLFFTPILLALNIAVAQAQNLTGKIVNETNEPVEFANVVLLSLPDSTFITGSISGTDGCFQLSSDLQNGLLKVSCIGYATLYKTYAVGDELLLQLAPDTQLLDEVVVEGDLPKTRLKKGASITQVAGSVLEKAGTAENLLDRIPGVSAGNGAVSVFGRGEAEVYINGRKVRDGAELDQLASDNIKTVEVVNNPGARYAASVKAVVRITTKRTPGEGFGFDNRLQGQYQYDWAVTNQFNFNYRKGGLDLSGMLYGVDERDEYYKYVRQDTYLDKSWTQHSDLSHHSHSQDLSAMLSLNYQVSQNQTFGVRYNYRRAPKGKENLTMYTNVLLNSDNYENADNTNQIDMQSTDNRVNAYYYGSIQGWEIDFNADGLWNDSRSESLGTEHSQTMNQPEEERTVTTTDENKNELYAAKLVLSHALGNGNLSLGGEFTHNNRTSLYDNKEGILRNENDEIREQIWATFAEYSLPIAQGNMQMGIRYEHMKSDYYQYGTLNEEQSRKYDNVFPSVVLSHPIGKVQIQLSYAADITRPDYSLLNSAPRYVNRYTYEAGNPLLQPTLSHNLTLDMAWKQLYASVGFQRVKDGMTSFCDTYSADNPAISLLKPINIEDHNKAFVMLVYSPRVGMWQPQFIASGMQQWYNASTSTGEQMFNHPIGSFFWKNILELPWGVLLNADASLQTKGHSENVHLDKSMWAVDLSLYKEFAKGFSIQFRATDLFNGQSSRMTAYSGIRTLYMNTESKRTFSLTLRYKFNTTKSKYKGTGAGTAQKNRM